MDDEANLTTSGPRHVGAAGTTWHVTGHGYDASRRVVMLVTSETEVEIAISLDELRLSFRRIRPTRTAWASGLLTP